MKRQDFLRNLPMLNSKRDNLKFNKFKLKLKLRKKQPTRLRRKLLRENKLKKRELLSKR